MDGTKTEKLTREERDRLVQKTALSNRNARAALAKILGNRTTNPSSPLLPSTRDRLLTETQGKLVEVRDIFESLKAGKRGEGVATPEDEFDQALREIGNPRTQTRRESPSSEQEEWAEAFDAFVPGAGQGPKPAHEEKSEFDKAADEALRATGDDLVPGPAEGVPEEDPLFESQDPRVEDPFGEELTDTAVSTAKRKIDYIHKKDARGAPKTEFEGVVNWGTADGNALAARAQSFDKALSKESGAEQEAAAREDVSMAQNLSRETIEKESQQRRREKMARGVSVYIRRSSGDLQEGKYVPEEGRVYFLDNPKDETSFVGYYENVTNEQLVPLNPHLAYTSKEGVALSGAADKLGQEVGDPNTWLEFERGVAEAKAKAYRDQEIDPAGFRHLQKNDAEVRGIARVGLSQGAKIGALVPETKKSVPRIDTHEKDRETNSLNGLNAFNSKIASQKGLPSPAKSIPIQREKSAVESRGGLETILVGQELSVSDHGEAVPVIVRGISGDQVLVEIKRSGDLMYVSRSGLGEKIPPSKAMVNYKEKPLEEVRASSNKRDAGYTVWEQGEKRGVPNAPLSLSEQKKLSGPAQAPGFPFSKLPTVPDMPLGKHPEAEQQKLERKPVSSIMSLGKPYKKIGRDGLEDFGFEEVPGTKPATKKRGSAGQEQKKTPGPLETEYTLEEYQEALNIFDTILPKIPKENSLTLMNTKNPVGKIAPETPPKPEGKGRVTQVPEVLIEEARQATKGFDNRKIKGMIEFREKNSSSKDLRNEASALRAILNEPKQTDSTVREKAVSSSSADKLRDTLVQPESSEPTSQPFSILNGIPNLNIVYGRPKNNIDVTSREKIPSDLFDSLQSYEQEVLQTVFLIRDWMENVKEVAVSASLGAAVLSPERTPAIRDAFTRLSLKEKNLALLEKIAGITLPIQLPNIVDLDKNINDFIATIQRLKKTSPQQIKTLSLSSFVQTQGLPTISENYQKGVVTATQIKEGEMWAQEIEAAERDRLKNQNDLLETLVGQSVNTSSKPVQAPSPSTAPDTSSLDQALQRDFDAERSVLEKKIEAQEVIIGVLEKRIALMEALEKTLSGAVSSEKLLTDPEQEETLKPTRAAKRVAEDLLAKEKSKRTLMQDGLAKLTQEEVEASKQLSTQTQQKNPRTAPAVNQAPLELNRILSTFEKEIGSQTTLAGLAELLISKEYKDKVFGTGTRKVTGKEIAKRISEKVLQAPKDAQIDPSFFIPDTTIAQKVFELIQEDTSWQKGVSSYGTPLIEKIDTPVQDEATKKALGETVKKVEAATRPGLLTRARAWVNKSKTTGAASVATAAGGTYATSKLMAGIFAFFFGAEVQAKEIPTQPAMSSDTVETVSNISGNSLATLDALLASNSTNTTVEAKDAGGKKGGETKDQTSGGSVGGEPSQEKTAQSQKPIVDPATGEVTLPETEAQKSTSEAESAGDETGAQEGLAVDPSPTPDTESRPKDYTRSLGKYVNYLNSVGRLDEFARVLTFGEKDPEKTTDGTINTRSFWWETMLLQPAENIIPNAKKSGRPDLTIKYRDFVRSQTNNIAEYSNLDDNSFYASNNLYKKFDAWYKNDVVSTIQALESELTPEERGYLDLGKNKKVTLGEYLAEVVRLSRKYDVRDVGLRTLSKEEEGKVVASLLAAPQAESAPSAEATPTQEGGDIFSLSYEQAGNAWWAIQALKYATNTPVSDQQSLMEWFNGPYYQMVKEWREQKSIGTTYTPNELLILQDAFQRLSDDISNKTEAGKYNGLMFSNLGTNGQNEQREVGKILEEIKQLLETLK